MRRLGRGLPLHVLTIQPDEIDRVEHQRREAAVAHRGCDDFPREREQQPRTFDHDQRMQVFLRYIQDAEHPGIGQLEAEHQLAAVLRLAFDRQRHLIFVLGGTVGADIDLDIDRRLLLLRRQRAGCVRVLEREVLGILRQHVQLGRRARFGRCAIAVGHESSSWSGSSVVRPAMGYHRPAVFHKDDHLQSRARRSRRNPAEFRAMTF